MRAFPATCGLRLLPGVWLDFLAVDSLRVLQLCAILALPPFWLPAVDDSKELENSVEDLEVPCSH